tara:strand:+ start:968 stop:1714 length:747 start_codon:yes stop_codon:yes gene_type:complete
MKTKTKKFKGISIVIPVFNEGFNIINLIDETEKVMKNLIPFEILVVDDGSTDNTYRYLRKKSKTCKTLKILKHSENYGQSISLRSGIIEAKEEYIITLDGDGQNNPKDIIKLLKLYNKKKSFLLLIGNRIRRNDSKIRKLVSRAAFYIRKLVFKDNTPDTGCAIKMFRKKDFLLLPFFNHIHRFFPVMFKSYGGEIVSIPVDHRNRMSGYSKYTNLQRAAVGLYDLIGVLWLRKRTKLPIIYKNNKLT